MYMVLPGCRTLKEEFRMFVLWFKSQIDLLVFKFYEMDGVIKY